MSQSSTAASHTALNSLLSAHTPVLQEPPPPPLSDVVLSLPQPITPRLPANNAIMQSLLSFIMSSPSIWDPRIRLPPPDDNT